MSLKKTVATLAVGAAAGAGTYLVMPAASAGVETVAPATSTFTTAERPGPGKDGEGCGPWGGWGSGEMPAWVEDRLDHLPAELAADLEEAWAIEDLSDRRDALRAIWRAARDGDYGAKAQEIAEDGPWGSGWGPGRGWGPDKGWGGGRGPWSR